jgi:hypothetical protein
VAKALGAGHSNSLSALAELFEHIEKFFRRFATYTKIPPTLEMQDVIVKVMIEVLFVLGVATKVIEKGTSRELTVGDG